MNTASRAESEGGAHALKSLADVAAWLKADTLLNARQKADYTSALTTLVKVTGKPLEHLPAHAGHVRRLIVYPFRRIDYDAVNALAIEG